MSTSFKKLASDIFAQEDYITNRLKEFKDIEINFRGILAEANIMTKQNPEMIEATTLARAQFDRIVANLNAQVFYLQAVSAALLAKADL